MMDYLNPKCTAIALCKHKQFPVLQVKVLTSIRNNYDYL